MIKEYENITQNADSAWFVKIDGRSVYGPFETPVLLEWITSGRLQAQHLVSTDQATWLPANSIPEFEMDWIAEGLGESDQDSFHIASAGYLLQRGKLLPESSLLNTKTGKRILATKWEDAKAEKDNLAYQKQQQDAERLARLQSEVESLHSKLDESTELARKHESDYQKALLHIKSREQALSKSNAALEYAAEQLTQTETTLERLRSEHTKTIQAEQARANAAEKALREAQEAHAQNQAQNQNALQEAQTARTQAETTLEHLRSEHNKTLKAEQARAAAAEKALSEAQEAHAQTLAQNQNALQKAQNARTQAEATLEHLRSEHNKTIQAEQARANAAEKALQEAQETNAQTEANLEHLRSEHNKTLQAEKARAAAAEQALSEAQEAHAQNHAQNQNQEWFLKLEDGQIFGPTQLTNLAQWATQFRIGPEHQVSTDKQSWRPAHELPELHMDWMITLQNGDVYGPIHFLAIQDIIDEGIATIQAQLKHRQKGNILQASRLLHPDIFAILSNLDQELRTTEQLARETKTSIKGNEAI